jgi:hypothetical protein
MSDASDIAPASSVSYDIGAETPTLVDRENSLGISGRVQGILVFAALFALCVGLQWLRGDLRNEFNGYPDEAPHYITGLMVRDYIAGFFPGPPLAFAENYYLHYPKVAFGQWPPLFYFVQAAWTLVFPVSHTSLLILMALIATSLAFIVFLIAKQRFGFWPGLGAGLLLLFAPITQTQNGMVMGDTLGAVFCFAAAIRFGQYLESEHWRDSLLFGILAALAILSKHNELSLAIMAPVAVLLAGKLKLLRTGAFWIAPAMVIFFCSPWDMLTFKYVLGTFVYKQGAEFLQMAMAYHTLSFIQMVGYLLFPFVLLGVFVRVVYPLKSRTAVEGLWAAMAGQVVSVWIFHVIVSAGLEWRHVLAALPALLMFAVAGMVWLLPRIPLRSISYQWRGAALAALLLIVSLQNTFAIPHRPHQGFPATASYLLANADPSSISLVSSEAFGEGNFIAEVASREQRPGHIILRATKVLAEVDWVGWIYSSKYKTPQQLMQYLENVPVRILVLDMAPGVTRAHHTLLKEVVALYPEQWKLAGVFMGDKSECPACEIRVYRLLAKSGHKPTREIGVSVKEMIRRY